MRSMSLVLLSGCLIVAGCSKAPNREAASADASEGAPAIDASVAPGVAFDFAYSFALPERGIATVQEQHAALCDRLGIARCRVTGLRFEKSRNGRVDAGTTFLLDPALALTFARDATSLVEQAEGSLATSRVTGEDAGKAIVVGDKTANGLRAELAKVEAELRIPGLSNDARGQLVARAGELRAQLRTLDADRNDKVESLATTPVRFDYEVASTGIGGAWSQGLGAGAVSLTALTTALAWLIGALGPWALLGGAAIWGVRRWRRQRRIAAVTP